ncbi:MAG TPA: acyl-CoA dehydrogenase family protein [Thermomicrobiaceae bacterium]|nr:acyl-CoA dehydrogenase family protein [Thermomicrobiaceae bacterium]
MDLFYTPEDEAFRAQVRAWLAENLPRRRLETLEEQRAWQRKLHEAGYLGMGWPVEYGGQNARPMEQAIVGEELARVNAPGAVGGLGVSIVGPTLIHHGTEAQKQRFVKNILNAEEIWCQLYSEPNSGSDLASLRTRAEIVGDEFVINGQKVWNSGAHRSDWGLLLARTDPDAPKHLGISCILVDMHSPGVEVRPLKQISGSSEFCEVFFSDVRVPLDNLVGELNRGWQIAQTTLSYERGGNTMSRVSRQLATFQRLLEVASALRRDGTRAIDNPVVRQKLGRMYTEIEVLRYGSLRILSAAEKGQRPGPESSVTKLYYSELDKRQQELIQEILGPYGQLIEGQPAEYALDSDADYGESGSWAYAFAWSRAGTIYAGSSEIQKNIIGERVLGLPKEIRVDRIEAQQAAQAGRAGNGAG